MKFLVFFALISISTSLDINCRFTELNFDIIGKKYTCNAEVLKSSSPKTINTVTGSHTTHKDNSHVEVVSFIHQKQINTIPDNLIKFFPNIIGIEIENGSVSNLTGNELKSYPNLKMLRLDFNQITKIPGNFFQSNPELVSVSFKSNWIKYVGDQLLQRLQRLPKLEFLNFNFNQCINTVTTRPNQVSSILRALRRDCMDEESKERTSNEDLEEMLRLMRYDNDRLMRNVERILVDNEIMKSEVRRLMDGFRSFRTGNCECRSGIAIDEELRNADGVEGTTIGVIEDVTEEVIEV